MGSTARETLALLRSSGNEINGVGESTPRRPSPFFWHPPDQHPWGDLQLLARKNPRKCPGSTEAFQGAYTYSELIPVAETRSESSHVEFHTQTLRKIRSSVGPQNTEEKRTPLQPHHCATCVGAMAGLRGQSRDHHLFADWKIALTMIFGSLVGGGTSEGGGAIAFPIFTKLLHIAPRDARNFSLAIQSVGMGAASLSIRPDYRQRSYGCTSTRRGGKRPYLQIPAPGKHSGFCQNCI